MAALPRQEWQKFKKKYGDFEKNRKVKRDLGPTLDQYVSKLVACATAMKAACASYGAAATAYADLANSLDTYKAAAVAMGNNAAVKDLAALRAEIFKEYTPIFWNFTASEFRMIGPRFKAAPLPTMPRLTRD